MYTSNRKRNKQNKTMSKKKFKTENVNIKKTKLLKRKEKLLK